MKALALIFLLTSFFQAQTSSIELMRDTIFGVQNQLFNSTFSLPFIRNTSLKKVWWPVPTSTGFKLFTLDFDIILAPGPCTITGLSINESSIVKRH